MCIRDRTTLINALAGLNLTYFRRVPSQLSDNDAKTLNQRVAKNVSNSNNDFATITYQVIAPPHSQLYVSTVSYTHLDVYKRQAS